MVGDVFDILSEASLVDSIKGDGNGCIDEVVFDLYGGVDDSVDFVRGGRVGEKLRQKTSKLAVEPNVSAHEFIGMLQSWHHVLFLLQPDNGCNGCC